MNKKVISFSIDEIETLKTLEEINDSQFSKIRIRAFSDGVTRHRYGFTLDVVKDAAFTILGKPMLFKYDIWNDDAGSHDPYEVQCGFVPKDEKDADIQFEYDDTLNKTFLTVNAYLWNVYQNDLIRILERDGGYKNVSVELWLLEYDEDQKDKLGYIPVTKFCFNGCTILGDAITEACEGADMTVVKFSIDEYEKAKNNFIEQLNNSIKHESATGSFLIQKNSKNEEVNMAKKLNAATDTPEVLDNGEKINTVSINVSEYTDSYDDDGKYVGGTSEYHSKSETTIEKTDDDTGAIVNADNSCKEEKESCETVENSIEEKCSTLEEKCSSLEKELTELKNIYSALELKCSSLEEYKNNKETEERTLAVECALNDVVDILTADEISQWREKSLNCATVDAFKNELKAFAFDKQKDSGVKPVETLRNSIPSIHEKEPTNMWDRLAKIIK